MGRVIMLTFMYIEILFTLETSLKLLFSYDILSKSTELSYVLYWIFLFKFHISGHCWRKLQMAAASVSGPSFAV